jgi:2-hydroxy-3-keto-5-methylthiopentenyl-1-phosphate phosphatase
VIVERARCADRERRADPAAASGLHDTHAEDPDGVVEQIRRGLADGLAVDPRGEHPDAFVPKHLPSDESLGDLRRCSEGRHLDRANGLEIRLLPHLTDLHVRRHGPFGEEGDRGGHRGTGFDPSQTRRSDGGLHARMPADLDLDPEERMAAGPEDRTSSLERGRRVIRLPDDARPVQLRCREVGERDEETGHLDHLATLDDLCADALALQPRCDDPVGEVHPGMLSRRYPAAMLPIDAVIVDFDGTACLHDVGVDLLERFGDQDSALDEVDRAFDVGEIGLRDVLVAEAAALRASDRDLIAFALEHCPLDPTFAPFAGWLASEGLPLTVVSDGFGLHVRPLLAAAGLGHLPVITNDWDDGRLVFGAAHPTCVGCGTCKKQAVERARDAHGTAAFVGDGVSDRFGARYADVTFAKDGLARHCHQESIPFFPYGDFDDVRRVLEELDTPSGPVDGEPCPGWREPT